MKRQALDELKQQIPLMGYLQAHDWHPARPLSRGRWMGLCPLHEDPQPSFLVDPSKNRFYCYGCGRGGDVIRLAELYHQVRFPQALALLREWRGVEALLHEVSRFYRVQLHRHSEAVTYLYQRGARSPERIEHMRVGYAPGGCLRGWLTQLGYPLQGLRQAGLVTDVGYDAYVRRIVFPLEGNLYGRSLSASDADRNGSGQQAAQCLSRSLRERGISTRLVSLPEGHDPNSFFVQGGDARQFQSLLEAARP